MKKVGAIISLSVIGLLIALTIILSVTTVSHKVNIQTPDIITVYNNGKSNTYKKDDESADKKEIYNDIISLIDESFKETTLTAIFNGNAAFKTTITTKSDTLSVSSGTWVRYQYNEGKVLKDGKKDFKTSSDQTVEYTSIYFKLTDPDEIAETKIYIVKKDDTYNLAKYNYTALSNLAKTNTYVQELDLF